MNIIETLEKTFTFDDKVYSLELYISAMSYICIGYRELLTDNWLCRVTVNPEQESVSIDSMENHFINKCFGNAKTLDDAAIMLDEYIKRKYINITNVES